MTDIYKAPTANFTEEGTPPAITATLEKGIAGEYDFSISEVLGEAWCKTNGNKGKIWLAFVLYLAVVIPFSLVLKFYLGDDKFAEHLQWAVFRIVDVSLSAGIAMLGVKLAVGAPVESNEVYQHIEKALLFVVAAILMFLMISLGMVCLVLPGVYLAVSYFLVTLLIAEKNMRPWQAMEASRKALTHHWFKLFFLAVAYGLIVIASALPAGIGLIWTLPMGVIIRGIIYRIVFGYGAPNGEMPRQGASK